MIGCSTPLSNGGTMFLGGIPLVTIPVIIRIFLVKAVHVVITIGPVSYTHLTAMYPGITKLLDKLAKTNVIHKNKANNLKSKLAIYINKLA